MEVVREMVERQGGLVDVADLGLIGSEGVVIPAGRSDVLVDDATEETSHQVTQLIKTLCGVCVFFV